MTLNTDELAEALQENFKLRRELATEVAEAKGEKLAAVRIRLARHCWHVPLRLLLEEQASVGISDCRGVDDVKTVPENSTLLNFDNLIGKRCSRSLSSCGRLLSDFTPPP